MINGLEGIPGSGKSYEAVVHHVLHYLKAGRRVITNLPLDVDAFAVLDPAFRDLIELRTSPAIPLGTWDADRTPAFLIEEIPPRDYENPAYTFNGTTSRLRPKAKLFGGVWDFYSEWKGKDGQGPVFIIDECHVGMPRMGTNPEVIEWYKLHRHFNVDVLLCTQSFRDVCPEISGLLAMLIKVRKADILGKKDCYIRKVHGGYRGAVISTEERPYHSQYFRLYKSHTQGNSVSEISAVDVTPMSIKFKRATWLVFALGFAILIGLWISKSGDKPKVTTKTVVTSPTGQILESVTVDGVPAVLPLAVAAVHETLKHGEPPEPYETKGFHLTGRASMGDKVLYMFTVSQNGLNVSNVTHKDLERVGYRWAGLTDCAGTLFWKEKAIPVTCDIPTISIASVSAAAKSDKGAPTAAN